MSPSSLVIVVLLAAVPTTMAKSETRFTDNNPMWLQNNGGHRFLQLQSELRNETCFEGLTENSFYCNLETTITSAATNSNNEQVNVFTTVSCNTAESGDTDFRQAEDCECTAYVTNVLTGKKALCSCVVCSSGGDHPVALDCGDDLIIDDCLSMDCDLTCDKTCSQTCSADSADDCVECPVTDDNAPELPVLADVIFNTTNDQSCNFTSGSTLACSQEARIYMPDNETAYSDVSITLECEMDAMSVLDPRQAKSCKCTAQVVDAASGRLTDCQCASCPAGFGPNPVAIICSEDFAVADCTFVDCNSQCNGICMHGCDHVKPTCSLCADDDIDEEPSPDPTDSCFDLQTFSTPPGNNEPSYYGIKFDLQAKNSSLELIGLELVVTTPDMNDTRVEVFEKNLRFQGGNTWARVANVEATVVASPNNGTTRLIISHEGGNFTPVVFEANETIGIYVRIFGPWLQVNLDDQSVEGDDFVMLPGVGLTSIADDVYDNATNPYFSGRFFYRSADNCQDCPVCPPPMDNNISSTEAPTVVPSQVTLAPTEAEETYYYFDLTVRLKGGKELKPESKEAFNNATTEFYRTTFQPSVSSRRRLQNVEFATFDTEVKSKGEDFDADGNTVVYDQYIKFSLVSGALTEEQAGALLLLQLTNTEKKNEYLSMLQAAHIDFESVTEVNPVMARSSSSSDEGLDLLWIILIAVGGAILCCCCTVYVLASYSARNREEKDEDYDHKNDVDRDAPEEPVYDQSEKSGEEIFSNESYHKTVPYGQDDDENFRSAPAPTLDEVHDADASEQSSSGGGFD